MTRHWGGFTLRISGKIGIGVAVLGLVLGTTQVATAAPAAKERSRTTSTVTLVTGDRVSLHNDTPLSIQPGKGREKMTFSRFIADKHTYVIPTDARQLISSGRLDLRLFDITTLVDFGYDDAHRDSVPLIVI